MKQEDCIFCKIVRGEILSKKIYEDNNFIAILDINPVGEGHSLVIPKKHFRNLLDFPSTLGTELLDALKKVSLNLIKEYKADGINMGINNEESAGQVVFHTHFHLLPRKKGDGIKIMQKC